MKDTVERKRVSQDCNLALGVGNDGVIHLAARGVGLNVLNPTASDPKFHLVIEKHFILCTASICSKVTQRFLHPMNGLTHILHLIGCPI